MPLFMDVHHIVGERDPATIFEAAAAPGVTYLRCWVDESAGRMFCLVEAPDADAARAVHHAAHGLVADEMFTVTEYS